MAKLQFCWHSLLYFQAWNELFKPKHNFASMNCIHSLLVSLSWENSPFRHLPKRVPFFGLDKTLPLWDSVPLPSLLPSPPQELQGD